MASIKIRSRLNHFMLIARITHVSAAGICGEAEFDRMPLFGVLEAMAQLAAMHVRHHQKFQRHAFLLKVDHGQWPAQEALTGDYRLWAHLLSQSSNAFAYEVRAEGSGGVVSNAELLIGTKTYGEEFKEDVLKMHYKTLFRNLQLGR